MIELPEAKVISYQVDKNLTGKRIESVSNATNPHKFAFFTDDPLEYPNLLKGKTILNSSGHGMFVDMHCDDDVTITISEGAHIAYLKPGEELPKKYQLLIRFTDASHLVFNVAMYGGIWAAKGVMDNKYYTGSLNSISPLDDAFDENHFNGILSSTTKDLSMKALLATEQRIPGLGNGVLQDILFNAGLHPRKKKSTLSDFQLNELFHSIKVSLQNMTDKGGRNTEKDFYGKPGGYQTILSKKTVNTPCPNCGQTIKKQAYLGGAIYFCASCQEL